LAHQLCHDILAASRFNVTREEFQQSCRRHAVARQLYERCIDGKQLPWVTSMELAILAACSPLAKSWHVAVLTQPLKLPETLANYTNFPVNIPPFCNFHMDKEIEKCSSTNVVVNGIRLEMNDIG
jgi:hypothetical protein